MTLSEAPKSTIYTVFFEGSGQTLRNLAAGRKPTWQPVLPTVFLSPIFTLMKTLLYSCSLALLSLLAGCKKDSDKAETTYTQLGETRIKAHAGFAFNGDPLAVTGAGESLRWRSSASAWERVAAGSIGPTGNKIAAIAEGSDGTYYGVYNTYLDGFPIERYFELAPGSSTWKAIAFIAGDTTALTDRPALIVNTAGDVAVSASQQSGSGARSRVFLKTAGGTAWTIMNDRPQDNLVMVQFTDGGDVFMQGPLPGETENSFFVMKRGQTNITPLFNCKGAAVLPYCDFRASIASNGEVVLYEGGIGSRKIYRAPVSATYPTTATEVFSFPGPDVLPVAMGCIHLGNGTTLASGNDNRYGPELFFLRRSGASEWQQIPEPPGGFSNTMIANRQGGWFINSQQFTVGDGNMLYKVNY